MKSVTVFIACLFLGISTVAASMPQEVAQQAGNAQPTARQTDSATSWLLKDETAVFLSVDMPEVKDIRDLDARRNTDQVFDQAFSLLNGKNGRQVVLRADFLLKEIQYLQNPVYQKGSSREFLARVVAEIRAAIAKGLLQWSTITEMCARHALEQKRLGYLWNLGLWSTDRGTLATRVMAEATQIPEVRIQPHWTSADYTLSTSTGFSMPQRCWFAAAELQILRQGASAVQRRYESQAPPAEASGCPYPMAPFKRMISELAEHLK